jgi:hypothetical protein
MGRLWLHRDLWLRLVFAFGVATMVSGMFDFAAPWLTASFYMTLVPAAWYWARNWSWH